MASARVPAGIWILLVGIHLFVFGWALRRGSWAFTDTGRYVQAAENMRVYGQLYARPWMGNAIAGEVLQEFTIRPAGYPMLLWALGGAREQPVLLLLLQNVLSLLNLGFVLSWWVRVGRPNARDWVWAALCILTFPAQFIYANAVMSEMVLQTVVLGIVAMSLRFIATRAWQYFAGIAVAITLALLLKPVFYPLAVPMAVAGILLAYGQRRFVLAFIGLLPLMVVGGYMTWNEQRTGYFHYSSITEINLLHYNAAGVVRHLQGAAAEEKWVDAVLQVANAQPDFKKRQELIRVRAGEMLWAHPGVYMVQQMQGMGAFFMDPGRFDISQFAGLPSPTGGGLLAQMRSGTLLRGMAGLPLALLGWLAVVLLANGWRLVLAGRGFWRLGHASPVLRYCRWIAVGMLLYVAILTGPLGAARFLVPVWPLVLALALVGLGQDRILAAAGEDNVATNRGKGC